MRHAADLEPQMISMLQKQLQAESAKQWPLACIPRPWKRDTTEDDSDPLAAAVKHSFPGIIVPDPIAQTIKPMFPELYFSVYADQDVEVREIPTQKPMCPMGFHRHPLDRSIHQRRCLFLVEGRCRRHHKNISLKSTKH